MKPLPVHTFDFEFLTPCFSGTAEGKNADSSILRVPPIRGHIRMWHVGLFGADDANAIWGSTAGDGCGSKVGVALKASPPASVTKAEILPHKDNANHRGPRVALPAGSRATLVLTRLPGCSSTQWEHAEKATKLWLLLGTLGLRANRAAGSIWPIGDWVPLDTAGLKTEIQNLSLTNWSVAVVGAGKNKTQEQLREVASDTVSERTVFGGINERKPSPTKFKVARLAAELVLLAASECKPIVLGPGRTPTLLQRAESLLAAKPDPQRWLDMGAWNHVLP
jgi:hypothetical protein